jgi:hypothetical protein
MTDYDDVLKNFFASFLPFTESLPSTWVVEVLNGDDDVIENHLLMMKNDGVHLIEGESVSN